MLEEHENQETSLQDLIDLVERDDLPTNEFTIQDKDPMVILGKLNEVVAYLESLQATINASDSKANEALQKAKQAVANAIEAVGTANTSLRASNTALSTANTAISTANTALNSANNAVETANNALSNSQTAVSTANTAETKAQEALEQVVTGLGTIVYRDTTLLNSLDIKPIEDDIANNTTAITALQNGKVDKVAGKQLSTEDFTTAEKNKLAELNNYDDTQVKADITINTNNIDTLTSSINNVINNTTKIANSNGGFSAGTGSSAVTGGAVGSGATTGNGFAGGYLAKTLDGSGNKIDAIQLGQGTNSTEKTLQIYGDNIYNASAHTFTMSQSNTLKWATKENANPYIGYCTSSYDGTFVIASKEGTTYMSGLAIGDTSGNLLWKGQRVLSVAEQGNDYIRFDSGIQICWGVKNNVSNNASCNFQQAFISNPTVVACQTGSKRGWNDNIKINDISTASFTVNSGGTASYYWLAIGKWK